MGDEGCGHRSCKRPLTSSAITAKNGKRYCKFHGEKLPSFLRGGGGGSRGGGNRFRATPKGPQSRAD